MIRKVLVAFSLALAVSLLPSAAFAHAGHDHGNKAKKVKKQKPKKGAAEFVVPRVSSPVS